MLLKREFDTSSTRTRIADARTGGQAPDMPGRGNGLLDPQWAKSGLDDSSDVSSPMVMVEDLHKHFDETVVLRGVNMQVKRGEVVCILGPSGTGKSTMLRCLNFLEEPTQGRIYIDGEPIGWCKGPKGKWVRQKPVELAAMRAKIGMVFQHFNLWPHKTTLGNVAEGLIQVKRLSHSQAEEVAMEFLAKVGMADKARARPSGLSGGQKQRVAIARAIAMQPKLILFDEPTSALDPELIGEVLETMQLLASEGRTMVIVTHEVEFAREVAHRVVFMDQGNILEEGTPDQVLRNPRQERTRQFLRRILREY